MNIYSLEFSNYEEHEVFLIGHEKAFSVEEFDDLVSKITKEEWPKIVFDTSVDVADALELCKAVLKVLIEEQGFVVVSPMSYNFSSRDYFKLSRYEGITEVRELGKKYTVVHV
jgi:hypothetical protein